MNDFEKEAEKFLTWYGAEVLSVNRISEGDKARFVAFHNLHVKGKRKLKALIAEFAVDVVEK